MTLDNNTQVFLALVQAGLWNKEVQLEKYGKIDFEEVYRLASEQSVIGLVTAGIEHIKDVKAPQEIVFQCIGESLHLEQANKAMNQFIAELIEKMRNEGIYTLIVKGQGVAQCYDRPLWRTCGDVDFYLSEANFLKAREFLKPLVENGFDPNDENSRNISAKLSSWDIELHANQSCGLSMNMDNVIHEVQKDVFEGGDVRVWINGGTQIFLPGVNSDVLFVFTHFLKHFYKGGLGLRQICDWCRLMWTHKDSLNHGLLESRIRKMGLVSEWKTFYNLASRYLGMPDLGSGLMVHDPQFDKRADRIMEFVIKSGNMGHNRDMSHYYKYPYLLRKCASMGRRIGDLINHARIFPLDSLIFFPRIMFNGLRSAVKGE